MSADAVELCAKALVLLGIPPITSFEDDSTEATVASNVYEEIINGALASYPWKFATTMQELDKLSDDPPDIWSYAYQIPSDFLHAIRVTQAGVPVEFDRYGDLIFCNADNDTTPVALSYVYKAPISSWIPHFRQAVMYDLASLFAEAVAGRSDLAKQFAERAHGAYRIARSQDSKSQTTRAITTSRLLAARRRY